MKHKIQTLLAISLLAFGSAAVAEPYYIQWVNTNPSESQMPVAPGTHVKLLVQFDKVYNPNDLGSSCAYRIYSSVVPNHSDVTKKPSGLTDFDKGTVVAFNRPGETYSEYEILIEGVQASDGTYTYPPCGGKRTVKISVGEKPPAWKTPEVKQGGYKGPKPPTKPTIKEPVYKKKPTPLPPGPEQDSTPRGAQPVPGSVQQRNGSTAPPSTHDRDAEPADSSPQTRQR